MKTLEQLNEKLNGKLWEKAGKKRIYLDKGYNTKKMKTTTYVEQNENGEFVVKCFIDCPSQDWNWIKSQQEQVIESVESSIIEAKYELSFSNYYENKSENNWFFELPNGERLYNLYTSFDAKVNLEDEKIYKNYFPGYEYLNLPTFNELIKSGEIKDYNLCNELV